MALSINIVLGANTAHFDRGISKSTKQAEQKLNGLRAIANKALSGINLGSIIGAGTLYTIQQTADQMQSLASKVRLATASAEEYSAVQDRLREIATRQRSSFEGVVDLYSSSQRALSALGKSQQDVLQFTNNMTTAMNVAGASADAQKAVLLQLGQALNMGALKGQEFNSVVSQVPILADLIAKKMGVSAAALKDLGAKGQITSQVIYDAVAGATKELDAMAAKMPGTITAALGVVRDNFGYIVHDILNESTGITTKIADVIAFVGANLRTIATVAGVAAAAIGAKMAHGWLIAKLGVDSLTGSMIANSRQAMVSARSFVTSAYSTEAYTASTTRAKLAVIGLGLVITGGGVMAVEQASLAIGRATGALTAFGTKVTTTLGSMQAYIAQTVTLANAKNALSTATARSVAAVTGFVASTRASIANGVAYTRQLFTINGAKAALVGATTRATAGVVAFGREMQAGTVSAMAYTRAIVTSTVAKRALVGTATLASRGVVAIGGAFASLGRIIMAHPLMIIGGIIAAIAVRTMGLQKAMDSLSDALKIVGLMLGDLVDMGIDGFMSLYNSASTFLSGFMADAGGTTSVVGQLFGGLFANTRGGFVGVLQVGARILDRLAAAVYATVKSIHRAFVGLWNAIKTGFANAFNTVSEVIANSINSALSQYSQVAKNINGLVDKANAAAEAVGLDARIGKLDDTKYVVKPIKMQVSTADTSGSWLETYNSTDFGIEKGFLGYADQVEAANKSAKDMGQQGAATAKALADASNAAKGKGKADKDGAKAGKEKADADDIAAEAAKKLAEAYENATKEFKKNQWMREHNRNDSETGKMTYEVLYGDMAKLPIKLKRDLIMAASQEDANKAYAEIQKSWHDHYESLETTGSNISRFLAQTRNEYNTLNSLGGSYSLNLENPKESWHIQHTPEYQRALSLIAEMDVSQVAHEMGNANIELQKQLDLLSAGNDYARSLLEIEQKQNETLEQYNALKELAPDEYKQIQTAIKTNAELQKRLATATAYKTIVDDMTTEEEKQLAMARERFAVIAEQQHLAAANGDALHPNANRVNVLNEMIGLGVQPSQNQFSQAQAAFEQKQALIDAFVTESRAKWQGHEDELTRISEEADAARIALRRAHFESMLEMSLSYASEQLSAAADFAKSSFGEQSKAYQVMFSLQKAVTISQASLAMYQAISNAMANSISPAQRATEIAAAMAQGLKIIAAIRSITNPVVGQAHDGIASVPREGTWILDKGERVVKPRDNDRLTKFLDNPNRFMRGESKVIINNYSGEPATATQENGDLIVTIGKMVGDAIDYKLAERDAKAHRQGWGY
ncbi:tape measure domain-containing protein [Moraxella cuniculi DSM 21768]|uniref:Tape measure domain-containing protein n=1 Tax=Moraxella cuniculi DSM 21768 TaxID=1122245 RepID=A0A1N7G7R9_9GAMM|nr:tape measure protein [Moraxella cuniculi]OOS04374.1 hypothetical protein B0189_08690 [Moraxella cuniculi]SIS08456.1 tape measure domain-containing protein [Moraxella cuniculi DSM 21768]